MDGILSVLVTVCFLLVACGGLEDQVASGEGETCTKTADCQSGLTCVDFVCLVPVSSEDTALRQDGGSTLLSCWSDSSTGLDWQIQPHNESMKWSEAKAHCNSLNLCGNNDWRLPTIEELRGIIRGCPATKSGGTCNIGPMDCMADSCRDFSCNGCGYGDGPADGCYWPEGLLGKDGSFCHAYWSSSAVEDDEAMGAVEFGDGDIGSLRTGSFKTSIRCVR